MVEGGADPYAPKFAVDWSWSVSARPLAGAMTPCAPGEGLEAEE